MREDARSRLAAALGLAGLLALTLGCGPSAPSIVLISLDSTRADRLGSYGYEGDTSPHMDRFARNATVYERAYSTSSWTIPSHASMFTGLLPMEHGVVRAGKQGTLRPLDESFETLAERLLAVGYRTGAVIAGHPLTRELGFAQGFEEYEDAGLEGLAVWTGKRARRVADQAIEKIERFGDAPYFLFVHFWDPHSPYQPPPPHNRGVQTPDPAPGDLLWRAATGEAPVAVEQLGEHDRDVIDVLLANYDAEIRYADIHVGRVLEAVARSPRADETLVIITADHGEAFGEHFYFGHTLHLYEPFIRVPLIVREPGQRRGQRVAEPIQNHAIHDLVLSAAGLVAISESPVAERDASRVLVTEVHTTGIPQIEMPGEPFHRRLVAVYTPPYKLIESSRGSLELYDLSRDPEELHDLAPDEPERVRALASSLERVRQRHPPRHGGEAPPPLDEETREGLQELGYLE